MAVPESETNGAVALDRGVVSELVKRDDDDDGSSMMMRLIKHDDEAHQAFLSVLMRTIKGFRVRTRRIVVTFTTRVGAPQFFC